MYRNDIAEKSRIFWALKSVKDIIHKKHEIDANDRFSAILFSTENFVMEGYFRNYSQIKDFIYNEAELKGNTRFPLDKGIQRIIKEKRKIGQKLFRIIVISDGFVHPKMSNPIKFAKVANDLGIIIDFLRFGKGTIPGNVLKRIIEITRGDYYYVQDEFEYDEIINKLAAKKKIKMSNLFSDGNEETLDEMSQDIASPLLKLDTLTEEQRSQVNFEDLNCAICHSERCMECETGFYGCGRFCPNCIKPIHLHCAIKWAEQQKSRTNGNYLVLRCPFCYYLLRIPLSIHNEKVETPLEGSKCALKKIRFSDEIGEIMTAVCAHPDCGIMFDETEDTYVYKCSACNNYFHVDCVEKAYANKKECPYCCTPADKIE